MFWRLAMDSEARIKRTSGRANREDGDATKARIIEAAGRLIAEHGYAETTSKDICEMAQTNIAAVNYHFGSRDGLYLAILDHVVTRIVDLDALMELAGSALSPADKLGKFIELLLEPIFDGRSWEVRIWAREMVAPSGLAVEMAHQSGRVKFRILIEILSELTGIPTDDPLMAFCRLAVMSPFMVLLVIGPDRGPHMRVFEAGQATTAENLKTYIFAGLDAIARQYEATVNDPLSRAKPKRQSRRIAQGRKSGMPIPSYAKS